MAKKTINIGTSANDRTGDNLRSAFNKINDNFDELYLVRGSLEFAGSTITTNDSSAIIIDQKLTVTSDMQIDGTLTLAQVADSSQPVDQNNPQGWVEVIIDGQLSWLPYYR